MQAIILAAGMGKRLGELTKNNTKCMVEVGGVRLIEIELDGSHKWVGKSLSRIHLGKGKLVVMIQRGEELIIPNGNTVFAPGDTIVIKER